MNDWNNFAGKIGRYHWESEPWWPNPTVPPDGAPNVVVFLLDDVGFAQLGCFGSDIETPVLDGLAAAGLRFNNFHTTALCSPTRACVLTGRNHHSVGMGRITQLATGFPGYHARIPLDCGFLPEMLTPAGYAAWAVGKWHLTPEEETHAAAPRDRWPLSRGFERFYGFFDGETHQFSPALVYDNHEVDPPGDYDDGYHLTEDLADHSIEFVDDLRAVDPDKPFLLYFCPGACHSPHQAPREWIDHYRGRFDEGWDVWRTRTLERQIASGLLPEGTELSPRPDWVPAWADLEADEQRVYARYMEAFAGFLSHTDHQLGRLLDHLKVTGDYENTLVLAMSDNGASSEGGPKGSLNDVRTWNGLGPSVGEAVRRLDEIGGPDIHNNYPWGWTVAGNTPFRRWKREVHEGGVADPLILSWPARVQPESADAGGIRSQYVHAIDIAPTVLDLVGVEPPGHVRGIAQRPIEGTSFAYAIDEPEAPERHTTQYYEMLGCRAIYHEGWKAATYHPVQFDEPGLDQVAWELYHVAVDPSECHDLAAVHPDKLAELESLWWEEAARYNVLPLDNRPFSEFVFARPPDVPVRDRYVYRPGGASIPEVVGVNVKSRPHTVTAHVDIPAGGAQGVLMAQGSILGGWAFYLDGDQLCYAHNLSGREIHYVRGDCPLEPGPHELGFHYTRPGESGGVGSLLVDGAVIAEAGIPQMVWNRFSITGAGLTCGRATAPAPTPDFRAPNPFTGTLHTVVIEIEGEPTMDIDRDAEIAIARQ